MLEDRNVATVGKVCKEYQVEGRFIFFPLARVWTSLCVAMQTCSFPAIAI